MKLEILGTTIKLLFEIGKWIVQEIQILMSGERGYAAAYRLCLKISRG